MDSGKRNSIPELKDFQIEASWIPATPAKPGLAALEPICKIGQENQSIQADWSHLQRIQQDFYMNQRQQSVPGEFLQCNDDHTGGVKCNLRNVATDGAFEGWEAAVALQSSMHKGALNLQNFSIDNVENCSNVSFSSLLAIANAAGTTASVENTTGHTTFGSVFASQNADRSPGCSRSFNLNSLPEKDAASSSNSLFQFAPITPAQNKGKANMLNLNLNLNLSIGEVPIPKDVLENVGSELQEKKEQSVLVTEQRTELAENHKPDKEGELGTEANKTPQQKPRRKKHRPKVVIEGQAKRPNKPTTPKTPGIAEVKAVKRTNARRKVVDSTFDESSNVETIPPDSNETPKARRRNPKRNQGRGATQTDEGSNAINPETIPPDSNETPKVRRSNPKRNQGRGATPTDEGSNVIDLETTPPGSGETSKGRSKYPLRNRGINPAKDPIEEGSSEATQPETVSRPKRSCKRSLNFDFVDLVDLDTYESITEQRSNFDASNVQNISNQDKSLSAVHPEQGPKADAELTEVNIAYDVINVMNLEKGKSFSQPGAQVTDPSTPSKIDSTYNSLIVVNQTESSRAKCKVVFSDVTHDKEESLPETTRNAASQCATSSQNSSNCSSNACLTEEAQVRGSKRQNSCLGSAELYNTNIDGIHYNSLQAYRQILPISRNNIERIAGMHFATIFKKKRTEKGHITATSSTKYLKSETHNMIGSYHFEASGSLTKNAANAARAPGFPKYLQPLTTDMMKKKRSKGLTRVRDLASLHEICKQFPTSSREATAKRNTCMEALVAHSLPSMSTKKRSKRNSLTGSLVPSIHAQHLFIRAPAGYLPALPWRQISPIDEITERLYYLNINDDGQGQYALINSSAKFQRENALVLYQRDGTITPFVEVKKRKARAKVDLDDETTRVWKLLLQDINSQGIDGTDEEKAKWWEEERNVFRGRADSFIARMRLVQGDRRFSPWKGSVVDSVVGVFLTQNVSDHLSSSAFMSMAARFPLRPNVSERTDITIEEPEVCIVDPDDKITWHEDPSNQPTPGQNSMTVREMNCKDEIVNCESVEDTSNCVKSTEIWVNKDEISFHSSQTEPDHVLSSQNSVVSSQNSADSLHAQAAERTESTSLGSATSFIQLLHMAGTSTLHGVYHQENSSANLDMPNQLMDCAAGFQKNKEDNTGYSDAVAHCSAAGFPHIANIEAPRTDSFGPSQEDDKLPISIREQCTPEQSESSTNQKVTAGESHKCCNNNQIEVNVRLDKDPTANYDSEIHTEVSNCNLLLDQECPTSLEIQEITERSSTIVDSQSELDGQSKPFNTVDRTSNKPSKEKGKKSGTEKKVDWDNLRRQAMASGKKRERTMDTMDSLDWEAVRCADVKEIADTIKERGMNNMLAERIKDFLNRLVKEHGSTNLEWLRDVPPDKAKEYLLSFRGLGLKSVECVRLLTLHHLAFPVDTNVGRIAVRLGWVPLQPLPESLQLHLLELYPILESIQKYLWPRLCKLDQATLYELHYHMITFGKVFCTKNKPNCNACPMRAECRHFASAFASARLALPAPEDKSIVASFENKPAEQIPMNTINPLQLPLPQSSRQSENSVAHYGVSNSQPIIEEPASPEPIIEVPSTPMPEQIPSEADIEDAFGDDPDEIPTINLNLVQLAQNVKMFVENNMELNQAEMSKALVALTPEAASIPMPKLKNISRLRTEHNVYELPDNHPLLEGLEQRDPDDPCSYLLAIWTPGETANSIQPPERRCDSQEYGKLCQDETCFACNSIREAQSQTVRGTILIPCRTAMRGSFPLNGTYFQVNEVFADHESSLNPIDVPRDWLWDLHRKTVFFGTSIPTIFKGLSTEDIQHCFWRGYVCVRGFDRKTRAPRPLMARLHFPASKLKERQNRSRD